MSTIYTIQTKEMVWSKYKDLDKRIDLNEALTMMNRFMSNNMFRNYRVINEKNSKIMAQYNIKG